MMRLVFEFLIDDFLNEKCLTSTLDFIASQFKRIVQNSVFLKSSKKFIFPTSFTSCYNRLKFFPIRSQLTQIPRFDQRKRRDLGSNLGPFAPQPNTLPDCDIIA